MKLRFLVPTLAALVSLSACDKGKKKDGDPADPAKMSDKAKELNNSNEPTPGNAAPAPDVAKTNELWSLAPEGAVLGLVVAPGSAATLHSMMMTVINTAESRPLGVKLLSEMREEAKGSSAFNPLDPASIKNAGIDLSGAVALFMVEKDHGYLVLPVSDREAFRKVTEGTLETIDGLEVDKHEDDMFCIDKSDRYLCSTSVENLKSFGTKVDGPLAKRVAALPAEYRGQAEFVMDVVGMKKIDDDFDTDFEGQLSDPQLAIGSLRFGNGAITARGWFQVKALDKMAAAVGIPNTLGASLAKTGASSLFSFRMPVALMTQDLPADEGKIPGIDLKKDVFGNLTGEMVGYTPQSDTLSGTLAIGLKDNAAFKTLLNMGCGLAPAAGIPGITVTPGDGKCDALIDVSKLPLPDPSIAKMFSEPVTITAEAKADRLEITFGKAGKATKASVSALGQELMNNKWNFSMWAEGMGLAAGPEIPWNQMPAEVPADAVEGIQMAVWMLSHVYEVGMAGAIREDGIHGVIHVATYAGDSDDAFKAYQAAVSKTLSSGKATAEFAAIKEKWPKSMAGRGGTGAGSMMIAGVTGMLAAVAIPAFMKYQAKSMEAMEMIEEQQREMEEGVKAAEKK